MSAERLAEIKARAEAATLGPWVRDMHSPDMGGRSGWHIRGPRQLGPRSMVLNSRMLSGDAEFVAAVREDVPWLVEQVERLERWKAEALEVMSGLQALGKALGLQPGVRITGPAALAEVARLTAERDALAAQVARVERVEDGLRGVLNRLLATPPVGESTAGGILHAADRLRAALAGSEADTNNTQPTDQEDQT